MNGDGRWKTEIGRGLLEMPVEIEADSLRTERPTQQEP